MHRVAAVNRYPLGRKALYGAVPKARRVPARTGEADHGPRLGADLVSLGSPTTYRRCTYALLCLMLAIGSGD